MTTITLVVPDELAAQFKLEPTQLPVLIREAVEARSAQRTKIPAAAPASLSQEIVNFLTSKPALEQVADFKISAPAQERLKELLEKKPRSRIDA